ncbi:MAG: hypothetical protein A3H98_13910 [Bacteroidetes bacterium RIFCSPLOWO2_02_FULL_36_8]|nr:MAG: hypothetical protein A3H98_13910 [Bacteroidetes bacterium RIFCSPLOWO2_02_FULL_36_8]OFY70992.1 MAG: hypothetical protein A3G23_12820 [Bacteroidetes bacterium RIFCSPLOWO2_12_FULL_37_12]
MNKPNSEITFADLLLLFREALNTLLEKRRILIISAFIFCLLLLLFSFFYPRKYLAETTIMLESTDMSSGAGAISQYLQLASGFGLGTTALDEDKLVTIFSSKRMLGSALLKETLIGGRKELLGNHIIELMGYKDNWEGDPLLEKMKFHSNQVTGMDLAENKAVFEIWDDFKENKIEVSNSKENIITLTIKTKNEEISKYLSDFLVESVVDFYVASMTEGEADIVKILENRRDSVVKELTKAETNLARWKDETGNRLVKAQGYLEEFPFRREVEILNVMYGEIVKNLETAKISFLKKKPVIRVIDSPSFPLEEKYLKPVPAILLGIIFGSFAGILIVLIPFILKKMQTA